MKNKIILLFSNEPWGEVWFSKHHYAIELSKNNIVFFINPSPKWQPKYSLNKVEVDEINSNLYSVNYSNLIPFTGKSNILRKINENIISEKIKKSIKPYIRNFTDIIFWSFDPFRFDAPTLFMAEYSLYLRMDPYINTLEKSLVANVDCFIACSSFLLEKYKMFSNKSLLIDHAVQKHDYSIEEIIKYEEKKNAVLVANLNYETDWEALKSIALHFPDWIFNIIGPVDIGSFSSMDLENYNLVQNYNNVTFWRSKPYTFVVQMILKSEICLCLYKPHKKGRSNSLKLIQYLSFGKKILSCPFFLDNKELENYITFSKDKESYIQNFNKLAHLNLNVEDIKKRVELAFSLSYTNVIEKIYKKVVSLK